MGISGLGRAIQRGAPLVDIVVRFRKGVDYRAATRAFNELGDDIDLRPGDWYGDPALRIGTATKEALERLFGWRLARVPLERYDEATGEWGTRPDAYRWEEMGGPEFFPPTVADLVHSMGITQPGGNDDGQWYE